MKRQKELIQDDPDYPYYASVMNTMEVDKDCLDKVKKRLFSANPWYISIEGNIGCGKSTLLANMHSIYNNIKKTIDSLVPGEDDMSLQLNVPDRDPLDLYPCSFPRICFLTEPFPKDLIKDFYEGKVDAFTFEKRMILEKKNAEMEIIAEDPDIAIFDRSVESCIPFINVMWQNKQISTDNCKELMKMINEDKSDMITEFWFLQPFYGRYGYESDQIDLYCKNINERNRQGESLISREYLIQLEMAHDAWLMKNTARRTVTIIDNYANNNVAKKLIYDLLKKWKISVQKKN